MPKIITDEQLERTRGLYENSNLTLHAISQKCGMSVHTVALYAYKNSWTRSKKRCKALRGSHYGYMIVTADRFEEPVTPLCYTYRELSEATGRSICSLQTFYSRNQRLRYIRGQKKYWGKIVKFPVDEDFEDEGEYF